MQGHNSTPWWQVYVKYQIVERDAMHHSGTTMVSCKDGPGTFTLPTVLLPPQPVFPSVLWLCSVGFCEGLGREGW